MKLELEGQIWPKEMHYGFTVSCPSIISDQEMLQQGECQDGKCNLSFRNQGCVVVGGDM